MNFSSLRIDWKLIFPALILIFISLITLFSINIDFFKAQLIFLVGSIVIFIAFSFVDSKSLAAYGLPIYIISIVFLFIVLLIGIESRGAMRWLEVFGVRLQFSEILKPFLAISFAAFMERKNNNSLSTFLQLMAFLLPVAFLIYRQPDLGNALIYISSVFLTLIFLGFSLKWFAAGVVAICLSVPILWNFLHQYQRERLLTFFHLSNDPLGISYNAIQSVIAVGSGMFGGKGLGLGTQSGLRFLPERHTDFIFATLSESLGFLGGIIVIIAMFFLLYRLYTLFQDVDDIFSKTFIASTFSLLFIQFFVNVGMNIGLVPIVGVTLPFVSYGGSSLLSSAIFLGIVNSIVADRRRKNVLEIT